MTFGEDWYFGASREESHAIFTAFCAAGGNFIDTANSYTYGTSEKLVGEFIATERQHFVVSTKYSLSTQPDDPNACGNHRKNMLHAVEGSLKRMNLEFIDVFWLHAWDSVTPIYEVMRGLDDLVHSGKVLYLGISDTPAWVVSQANMLAELRGWSKFIGLQAEYNLIERTAERDLLPMAQALNLGVLAWAPLAGGVLTGKYVVEENGLRIEDSKRGDWLNAERLTPRSLRIAAKLAQVARECERSPAQVALNWLRRQPGTPIPIIAGRTLAQMEQNLGCLGFEIEKSQLDELTAESAISLGFPHRFLAYEPLRQALFGNKRDLFDFLQTVAPGTNSNPTLEEEQ
jgi:aryl-alcohol dehydrogenase-like predicted oxidoreductase